MEVLLDPSVRPRVSDLWLSLLTPEHSGGGEDVVPRGSGRVPCRLGGLEEYTVRRRDLQERRVFVR